LPRSSNTFETIQFVGRPNEPVRALEPSFGHVSREEGARRGRRLGTSKNHPSSDRPANGVRPGRCGNLPKSRSRAEQVHQALARVEQANGWDAPRSAAGVNSIARGGDPARRRRANHQQARRLAGLGAVAMAPVRRHFMVVCQLKYPERGASTRFFLFFFFWGRLGGPTGGGRARAARADGGGGGRPGRGGRAHRGGAGGMFQTLAASAVCRLARQASMAANQ